ncbi:putative peripheral membrane protein [Abortiporus biennis]|nr:putative peripheral membrane protein [Abortiporus biennis]
MLQISRAEDGQVFQVNASYKEIERLGNLEHFLQEETGVDQDSVLAYLSDGTRLTNSNIRDLAGAEDQTIFVFNKAYLDLDLDEVLRRIHTEPLLQPPVEDILPATPPFKASQLATSYLRTAHIHSDDVDRTLRSLRYQNEALRIASSALDLHVLALVDAFDRISANAQPELERQAQLLAGLNADLEIVGRVMIHREFMSPSVRKAMELGDKGRTLGDYVSRVKMRQVAETCLRTHEDLKERFAQAQESLAQLQGGAGGVRTVMSDTGPISDAEICARRTHDSCDKMSELVGRIERSPSDASGQIHDIRQLDASIRSDLQRITEIKNSYSERCIGVLRQISILNNYIVKLPVSFSALQASFRAKTSFSHIQRLHNMLYAYGATVIEVVRRKEFAQFFFIRAQGILEVMAKFSAGEQKKRQVFRGDVQGQLPFELRGMDDPVPAIDFSPTGSHDSQYSLELHVLDDLDRFARESPDPAALASVTEARSGLEKMIGKMDSLETGFDRIAERSLTEVDEQAYVELEAQISELARAKDEQQHIFDTERQSLEAEISHLRATLEDTEVARSRLERDLHSAKASLESESTSRRILEQRKFELSSEALSQRETLATALSEATEKTKEAEYLRQELSRVRAEFEEVKDLESRNAQKITKLLEEQANALGRLEEARARGEDLEAQIASARAESDEVKLALLESGKEKDRLLRAQASEHDRLLRDHIAEADGDRAVLEHQNLELKAALEDIQRQLKDVHAQADMTNSDAIGLREELQRVEHELREARHVERVLREDLRAGRASQSDYELKLENSNRLVAQILDVALQFRESHVKAFSAAQAMSSHPFSKAVAPGSSMTDSGFANIRRGTVNHMDEPSPIDPSDPAAALEALRAFDHDQFLEAINKTGSTIRKWQKQCKEYRERAKGKISFRNFAKGDLALFLPTRNSVSKPWAAFNVSFPHYFLNATGQLAEQLKTREWIVARITSMTERVVDYKDASSNPFGLGDGVKYYMLEVEDWAQNNTATKRRSGGKKHTTESPSTGTTPEPPTGPPETEVEEAFTVTRPPNSKLFPSPSRVTSPPSAGPSSLSRLLAQASPSERLSSEPTSSPDAMKTPFPTGDRTPSRSNSPPPPPSPAKTASTSTPHHGPNSLRPGSRASRISTSSKFSSARIPFAGSSGVAKATATTALTEQIIPTPSSSSGGNSLQSFSPSPEGSPTEGITSMVSQTQTIVAKNRKRPLSSYHAPSRNSPLAATVSTNPSNIATVVEHSMNGRRSPSDTLTPSGTARSRLASLASSWGVAFGRSKKANDSPTTPSPDPTDPVCSPSGDEYEG